MIRIKAKKSARPTTKASPEPALPVEKKPRAQKKKADDLPEVLKHEEAVKTLDQPKRRSRGLRVVRWVIGLSVVFVAGCAIAAYGFAWRTPFAMKIYRILPLPAAVVETRIVTLYQYYDYLDASEHYNQSEEGRNALFAFKSGELERIALERLIDNALTSLALAEAKVTVTEAQLTEVIRQMSSVSSEAELEKQTQRLWGWDLAAFKKNILRPDVEKLELQKYLTKSETLFADIEAKAESVRSAIEKKEISFEEAVEQDSEDEASNARGGDLGWILASTYPEPFWKIVSETEVGKLTPVFRMDDGFHLVEVLQKQDADGDEEAVIKARQILWKTPTAQEWLTLERNAQTIWTFVKFPPLES